jgi:hypothetical protein
LSLAAIAGCASRPEQPVSILGESVRQSPREAVIDTALVGTWVPKNAELAGKPFSFAPGFEMRIGSGGSGPGGLRYGVGSSDNYYDRGRVEVFGDELAGQARRLDTVGEVGPNKGKRFSALYRMVGRDLEIVYDLSGANRPVDFVSREGTQLLRVTYSKKP